MTSERDETHYYGDGHGEPRECLHLHTSITGSIWTCYDCGLSSYPAGNTPAPQQQAVPRAGAPEGPGVDMVAGAVVTAWLVAHGPVKRLRPDQREGLERQIAMVLTNTYERQRFMESQLAAALASPAGAPEPCSTPGCREVKGHFADCPVLGPEPIDLVRQARRAAGLFDGAMPISPKQAWEEALGHIRRLASPAGAGTPPDLIEAHCDCAGYDDVHLVSVEKYREKLAGAVPQARAHTPEGCTVVRDGICRGIDGCPGCTWPPEPAPTVTPAAVREPPPEPDGRKRLRNALEWLDGFFDSNDNVSHGLDVARTQWKIARAHAEAWAAQEQEPHP